MVSGLPGYELGYKYNLTDIAASIGLQQLSELDSNIQKKENCTIL